MITPRTHWSGSSEFRPQKVVDGPLSLSRPILMPIAGPPCSGRNQNSVRPPSIHLSVRLTINGTSGKCISFLLHRRTPVIYGTPNRLLRWTLTSQAGNLALHPPCHWQNHVMSCAGSNLVTAHCNRPVVYNWNRLSYPTFRHVRLSFFCSFGCLAAVQLIVIRRCVLPGTV